MLSLRKQKLEARIENLDDGPVTRDHDDKWNKC